MDLVCHLDELECSFACDAPTRTTCDARAVGRAVLWRRLVRVVAGLRRARLCGNADGVCVLPWRDAALRRARRGGFSFIAFWFRRRIFAGRRSISCIPDLRTRDKYYNHRACRSGSRTCICAAGAGDVSGAAAHGGLAGLRDTCGRVGDGEAAAESVGDFAVALAMAVSGRKAGLRSHGAAGVECGAGSVPRGAPIQRCGLLDRLGQAVGILYSGEFYRVWMHRDSVSPGDTFYPVRSAMG